MKNLNKGFTLIELLVVISIISFLSSIILNSVNSARVKAKDSAIKAEVKQMAILMDLEYSEKKSYANLQQSNAAGWMNYAVNCTSGAAAGNEYLTASNYATKAADICKNIIANNTTLSTSGAFHSDTSGDNDQRYSIMAALSNGDYYCVGSSGSSSGPQNWASLG